MIKKNRRQLGATLLLISALMLILSLFGGCIYWYHPVVFISFSVFAPPFAFFGPFLLCKSGGTRKLVILGGILTTVSIAGWIASIIGAASLSTSGYWGEIGCGFASYDGDYIALGLQIMIFFATVVLSAFGGLFIGIKFGKKM